MKTAEKISLRLPEVVAYSSEEADLFVLGVVAHLAAGVGMTPRVRELMSQLSGHNEFKGKVDEAIDRYRSAGDLSTKLEAKLRLELGLQKQLA